MEMRKEPSVEFELDGLQDSDSSPQKEKLVPQSTEDTQFREADFSNDSSAELVLKLQRTLKSEQLILHHGRLGLTQRKSGGRTTSNWYSAAPGTQSRSGC